jgi:hypothetical protein
MSRIQPHPHLSLCRPKNDAWLDSSSSACRRDLARAPSKLTIVPVRE